MGRVLQFAMAVMVSVVAFAGGALAQSRNALVIGNSAYESAPALKTPATDASIVAETLKGAGYDVTELRDLRQANIGQVMRDFLDKVAAGGPDGVALVYYSGYGVQADGENYLVPIDAVINTSSDVASEAFRLNDLLDALASTPLAARIVILDAARDHKFGSAGGKPLAKGLAMANSFPGTLLAFSAAPGALSIDGDGDYSLFTGALVTMMRQPGLDLEQILKATRLAVNKETSGAQTPWMVSTLGVDVGLFAATAATPEPKVVADGIAVPPKQDRAVTQELMSKLTPDEAYAAALDEDTLEGYQLFVEKYPDYPQASQIWAMIETRREAVLWRRTLAQNTTRAYWNYIKRYPNGAHVAEAQEALAELSAPPVPPPNYVAVPVPLPPDYYDEAVDLAEIVPEGYDLPVAVFDLIAPIFIRRPPPFFFDRGRRRFPPRIPGLRGDPVRSFTNRGPRPPGDRKTKTGIMTTAQTGTKKVGSTGLKTPKPGVKLPTGTRRINPIRPPAPAGTPGTRRPGVGLPPSATTKPGASTVRPTTPGVRSPTATHPTAPTVRTPVAPGVTHPTTTLPTKPGTTPGQPTVRHPGLPPVPGTTRSTTQTAPATEQHPGLAPSTTHPTAPTGTRPTAPPTHPVAPPVRHPTPPTTHPVAPTAKQPAAPSATKQPTAPPTTRPTTRAPTRPTSRPVTRPTPARKLPSRRAPSRPAVRSAPSRPAVRAAPPRPAARAPARPAPAAKLPQRKK